VGSALGLLTGLLAAVLYNFSLSMRSQISDLNLSSSMV
jgi:hypothetical protein